MIIGLLVIACGVAWICWRILCGMLGMVLSDAEVEEIHRDCAQDYARDDARRGRDAEGWWKQHGESDQ